MNLDELMAVLGSAQGEDAFRPRFSHEQWRLFLGYLSRRDLKAGETLLAPGDRDRSAYFLGAGTLEVFRAAPPPAGSGAEPAAGARPGGGVVALLRPGALIGELGLFSDGARSTTVEAMTPCTVWMLSSPRFDELAGRNPGLALEALRAAGAVMAARMRANLLGAPGPVALKIPIG